jgi:hypothetical protein
MITWILCVPILVSPGWLLVRLIRDEDSSPIEEGLLPSPWYLYLEPASSS